MLAVVRPTALGCEDAAQTDKLGFASRYALNGDANDEKEDGQDGESLGSASLGVSANGSAMRRELCRAYNDAVIPGEDG